MAQLATKPVFIFEGPDGAGKTTAATHFAGLIGAHYVHCGPFKGIKNIGRLYVEAMMPALIGYKPVVLDRSWHSEIPYAVAYREGESRLGRSDLAMLDRLAMRCGGSIVCCLPDWDIVKMNFEATLTNQMLQKIDQLAMVYDYYQELGEISSLPIYRYNYAAVTKGTDTSMPEVEAGNIALNQLQTHWLDQRTAGNWNGRLIIIGDEFGAIKNEDPLYQWPFASFSNIGCSRRFTEMLVEWKVDESDLLWINADQNLSVFFSRLNVEDVPRKVLCLGERAQRATQGNLVDFPNHKLDINFDVHPQYLLRFSDKLDVDTTMARIYKLLNEKS